MPAPRNTEKTPKTAKAAAPPVVEAQREEAPQPDAPTEPAEAVGLTTVDVTQDTLDSTPERLLQFLRGVGTRTDIQTALAAIGYDAEEHARGWSLLHACSGFSPTSGNSPQFDREVSEAIATLDARDERTHSLIDASLMHRAPTAHTALLKEISPGRGAESVVYFHALLGRIDQLAAGTLEGVNPADAAAALAVLAKRGFNEAWRAEHRALVTTAQRLTGVKPAPVESQKREELQSNLKAARAWFEEWSRNAHTEVKRKDYLIALGLASRKSPAPKTAPSPDAPKPADAPKPTG